METELKPCPFDQGRLVYISQGIPEENRVDSYIQCETCGMRGPSERTHYDAAKPDLSKAALSRMRQASIDKWNALPRRPRYEKTIPVEPGRYWIRRGGGKAKVVQVDKNQGNGELYISPVVFNTICYNENVEWAGPIPEPEVTDG